MHNGIEVERRYTDFEILRQTLACEFPGLIIPRLPAKDASVAFQQADSESIQSRLQGFQEFLMAVNSHPELALNALAELQGQQEPNDPHLIFLEFLTIKPWHEFEAWKEAQKKRIDSKKYIFSSSHASLLGTPCYLPETDSSLPGMELIGKAVDTAKTLVMGS